jgi:hypothetical protein
MTTLHIAVIRRACASATCEALLRANRYCVLSVFPARP